jgi:hypothetical protein
MVDYRAFGAGALIQGGGKRLRAPGPQPLVEVPNIELEVVFEIVHVMSAGHTKRLGKFSGLSLARILKLCEMSYRPRGGRFIIAKTWPNAKYIFLQPVEIAWKLQKKTFYQKSNPTCKLL